MNKNDIIDHLGAEDWEMVKQEYKGKTLAEIEEDLSYMWPKEDNSELAAMIFERVN